MAVAGGPIDAVYTWVDDRDPFWRDRRRSAMERTREAGGPLDSSAASEVRFRSRDELRYSLRALERFAPFVRRVHLVTDHQLPRWLALDHPQLQVVFHDALFPDPAHLPSFSSQAIESHLHRIPGLSERFVYFNDDILLYAPVRPTDFFDEEGRCVVYLDRRRVVWDPEDPSYSVIVNSAARNSSRLLEELGAPRITHRVDHTPYALTRSILAELWERFPKELESVSRHPFRHAANVAPTSCLAQYYAIHTGRGVPVREPRLTYFKVKKKRRSSLKLALRLLRHRFDRTPRSPFLSINDSGRFDDGQLTAASIALFFASTFPRASRFEKRRRGHRSQARHGSPTQ